MAWVRVLETFDWDPPEHKGRVTLSFQPSEQSVRKACADAAVAAGKAVRIKPPGRVSRGVIPPLDPPVIAGERP